MDNITIHIAGDLIVTPQAPTAPSFSFSGVDTIASTTVSPPSQAGRIKILGDGTYLPVGSDRTDHVAVLDQATGLMWSVESLGDPSDESDGITQEHCMERCKELQLLDFNDWRLPTRAELAGLIDDTRHEPAIDTDLFPRVKPRWHWTSTPAAWSSASAWYVGFYNGGVYYLRRYDLGFALAVRRAGQ